MRGIYKIENNINKKIYIGSSENIARRWTDHIYLLNKNNHHSLPLQRAWSKYGASAFTFTILELCTDDLLEKEQWFLNDLLKADEYSSGTSNTFLKLGYNIKPTAQNNTGYKHSEETIVKMLESKNTKKVLSINIIDNSIMEFISTGYAAKHFNLQASVVRTSIYTKRTCKKLIDVGFIYKKDYKYMFKPKQYCIWNKVTKTGCPALNAKPVYVKNLINDEIKVFKSIKECALFYKTNSPFIHKRITKGDNICFDRKGSKLFKLRMFYEINEM